MKHNFLKSIGLAVITAMIAVALPTKSIAQDNVGIGTNTPDASAILELLSANKGMLVPRMNTAGMNAIAAPANSLLIYNTDSMCYFFYRVPTTTWVSLCTSGGSGSVGPTGPAGAAGTAGTIGATGLDGATGAAGTAGVAGATGATGVGTAGATGVTGSTGAVGPTGVGTGTAGSTGSTGPTGSVGTTGVAGATGNTGTAGATGNTGVAGATGNTGAAGATGNTGTAGATGNTGVAGATGNTGAAGATGNTGVAGATGNTGTAGATGATGADLNTHWTITGNAGTNGGTTLLAGTNFLGTTDAQNIDIRTNNIYRARFSQLGEFFVGTLNTALVGDLMNVVSNVTFPWAINGYSAFNGGGVYGSITAGTTAFGGVQGEYLGTAATGAGVRGIYISATAGTGFNAPATGVNGNATSAGTYKFGVFGSGGATTRSGGVMGYDFGVGMGGLGYFSAGALDYGVYGFGTAYQAGLGTGIIAGGGGSGLRSLSETNVLTEQNTMIGLGIYGGVMGGWVRGLEYGFHAKGNRYGLYVDGTTFTNNPITQLIDVGENNRIATQATMGLSADVQTRGKAQMSNGQVFIAFDQNFIKTVSNLQDVIITVTPKGNTNGVYVSSISSTGFTVNENNGGSANVEVSWIAVGTIKGYEDMSGILPSEVVSNTFDGHMNAFMFNDSNTMDTPGSLWWDGSSIRFDAPPAKQPDLFYNTNSRTSANTTFGGSHIGTGHR